MYKLLKAGLFRLRKDIIFWIFTFLSLGVAGFTLFRYYNNSSFGLAPLDKFVNEYIMYIGIFIAIFVSIFVGKEHSEGIIRNKIIVGHKRVNIYLSNLIISVITTIFYELIYLILMLIIGIPLFGKLQMTSLEFVMSILNVFLVIIAYCSIFNLVTMLSSEVTIATTICIILFIAMFVVAGSLSLTVNASKYITNTYYDEEGAHIISQELDPNYPGEEKIKIARTIYYFIPQGQANDIANGKTEDLSEFPLYSISLIIIVNVGGIFLFNKKELK